jgi:hypothetical protein
MVFNVTLAIFQLYRGISFIGGGNHRPAISHWQTLSHNAVSTVENNKNNAVLLVNSLKIKRQIWIFKTYFWFIYIRHCIHNTKSWLRWINLCGKLVQTIFSFMRSPENISIEIMQMMHALVWKAGQPEKEIFHSINNYMHRRRIIVWTQRNGTHSEVANKPQYLIIATDLL